MDEGAARRTAATITAIVVLSVLAVGYPHGLFGLERARVALGHLHFPSESRSGSAANPVRSAVAGPSPAVAAAVPVPAANAPGGPASARGAAAVAAPSAAMPAASTPPPSSAPERSADGAAGTTSGSPSSARPAPAPAPSTGPTTEPTTTTSEPCRSGGVVVLFGGSCRGGGDR